MANRLGEGTKVDTALGHTPQSKMLIDYLAIDRERSKTRLFDPSLEEIQNQLEEANSREKHSAERTRRQNEENVRLKNDLDQTRRAAPASRGVIVNVRLYCLATSIPFLRCFIARVVGLLSWFLFVFLLHVCRNPQSILS